MLVDELDGLAQHHGSWSSSRTSTSFAHSTRLRSNAAARVLTPEHEPQRPGAVHTGGGLKPVKVEYGAGFTTLYYVFNGAVTGITIVWSEISYELLNKKEQWSVRVRDAGGKAIFTYRAQTEAKARTFVDALETLRQYAIQAAEPTSPVPDSSESESGDA